MAEEEEDYPHTLRMAQLAVGGISALAARLNVPIYELTRWIEGLGRPPADVYREAQAIAQNRRKSSPDGPSK